MRYANASPWARGVKDGLVLVLGEAGHPRELFKRKLFPPGPDSDLGIVELVVASEHHRLQRHPVSRLPACQLQYQ